MHKSVLISGASIAGPALAYWLGRRGIGATIVERAPALRRGGQAIDVRGGALEVVRRMGLEDALRGAATAMRGMSFVDGDGNVLMSTDEATLTGGAVGSGDVELMRDDLAALLLAAVPTTEVLFDDSIRALDERPDGVDVHFERAPSRRFDLVIGADGLHSNVRALAFGPESDFIRRLGIWLAVFTVPNDLGLDHWQVFHRTATGMVGLYSARANTEARAILGFGVAPAEPGAEVERIDHIDHRDVPAQQRRLREAFADAGWEAPRLLAKMADAPDFHCDEMSQIHIDTWSRGRVALVGDAAYCSSPLSGQGTSLALVGAYVLAEELAREPEHATAFTRYQARMAHYVAVNQALAQADREGPPDPAVLAAAANAMRI